MISTKSVADHTLCPTCMLTALSVMQFELSTLIIQYSSTPDVAAPSGPEGASVPLVPAWQFSLSDMIGTINTAHKVYSTSALLPTPQTPFKH